MKIIVAPDSFKGALTSVEVARTFADGWLHRRPQDHVLTIPLADGGEGTTRSLIAATGGECLRLPCHDSLMRPMEAEAGITPDKTAVIEIAAASGIERLRSSELNPAKTTTYGTGELIGQLIHLGLRRFIIGLGGSATVDGGIGILQALGAKFFTDSPSPLPPGQGGGVLEFLSRIDTSGLMPELKECQFKIASDVTNPLLGPQGAAPVFGPQKGASPEQIAPLSRGLSRWAELWHDKGETPGDGAAGGTGFLFRHILKGESVSGAKLLIEASGLPKELPDADWVITGEGCSDNQSAAGKLPAVVADIAASFHVPVILCSGALKNLTPELTERFVGCFSISPGPCTLEEALRKTRKNLFRTATSLAGILGRNHSSLRRNGN